MNSSDPKCTEQPLQDSAIIELIDQRVQEWHDRVPDEKPDWHEACIEIRDAIERGEHHG